MSKRYGKEGKKGILFFFCKGTSKGLGSGVSLCHPLPQKSKGIFTLFVKCLLF